MTNEYLLLEARQRANKVRYSGDLHDYEVRLQPFFLHEIVDEFSRSALEISSLLTPELSDALNVACERLGVSRSSVYAFVYSSHEPQAACYYTDTSRCLIRLSSALANSMSVDELSFVFGHELGHFLLQHSPVATDVASSEYFVFQRAKEISADRVGLFACSGLETAILAFLKSASGLSSSHLNGSVLEYVKQIGNITNLDAGENPFNTHPSMIVRANVLTQFSLGTGSESYDGISIQSVLECDRGIRDFLDSYVDADLRKQVSECQNDLKIWLAAVSVCRDGRFDQSEQKVFEDNFGIHLLEKMKAFLASCEKSEVLNRLQSRVCDAESRLTKLTPSDAHMLIRDAQKEVGSKFGS